MNLSLKLRFDTPKTGKKVHEKCGSGQGVRGCSPYRLNQSTVDQRRVARQAWQTKPSRDAGDDPIMHFGNRCETVELQDIFCAKVNESNVRCCGKTLINSDKQVGPPLFGHEIIHFCYRDARNMNRSLSLFCLLKSGLGIGSQCCVRRQVPVWAVGVGDIITHESISSSSSSHSLRISLRA